MVLAIDRNQRTAEFDGAWIWRKSVELTIVTADRHAVFELPKGSRILGGFIDVEVVAVATSVTADLTLENDAGDVVLATAVDLEALGRTAIDIADEGVEVDVGSGATVDVVIDITSDTPTVNPVVTVGLEIARPDYTR